MAKEVYYFSHDYDPTGDPKITAMLGEYGGIGYGCFWRLTEMLHVDEKHALPLKKYIFLAIAQQMQASADFVEKFIKSCIEDYELFETDGKVFWSKRVNKNIGKRDEISEKRSKAGKTGSEVKKKQASVKQTSANAEQNLANASKGNEIKGNIDIEPLDGVLNFFKQTSTFRQLAEKYRLADLADRFIEFYNLRADLEFKNKTKQDIVGHFSNALPNILLKESSIAARQPKQPFNTGNFLVSN